MKGGRGRDALSGETRASTCGVGTGLTVLTTDGRPRRRAKGMGSADRAPTLLSERCELSVAAKGFPEGHVPGTAWPPRGGEQAGRPREEGSSPSGYFWPYSKPWRRRPRPSRGVLPVAFPTWSQEAFASARVKNALGCEPSSSWSAS